VRTADGKLVTFMCRLPRDLGASTSWKHQGLVQGFLYLFPSHDKTIALSYNFHRGKKNPIQDISEMLAMAQSILHLFKRLICISISRPRCKSQTSDLDCHYWFDGTAVSHTQTVLQDSLSATCAFNLLAPELFF